MDSENYECVQKLIEHVREISILTKEINNHMETIKTNTREIEDLIISVDEMEKDFYFQHLQHTINDIKGGD